MNDQYRLMSQSFWTSAPSSLRRIRDFLWYAGVIGLHRASAKGPLARLSKSGTCQRKCQHGNPSDQNAIQAAADIALDRHRDRLVVATQTSIQLWDLGTSQVLSRIAIDPRQSISISLHPKGEQLAVLGAGTKIELLNVESGKPVLEDSPAHSDQISFVAYSPNGEQVITGERDKKILVWDAESGRHLRDFPGFFGQNAEMASVGVSPNGQTIVVFGYRVERREDEQTVRGKRLPFPFESEFVSVPAMQFLNATTGELRKEIRIPSFSSRVAFSSDSRILAVYARQSSYGSRSDVIWLFDLESGKQLNTLWSRDHHVMALAFSDDGERLWSVSKDAKIRRCDLSAKVDQEFILSTERADCAAISVSSLRAATVSAGPDAHIWDLKTGQLFRQVEVPNGAINFLAFSPDGSKLAMGTDSRSLSIHNIETGTLELEVSNLPSRARVLAFSPDGKCLISGMEDSSAIIWKVPGKTN